mmetsp:Transcript_33092/g.60672  ORF Transcript_33092/g.60672 Transcript_33092/m.60672 type:complete len:463 (+) Transcript_33092:108-1496(+)
MSALNGEKDGFVQHVKHVTGYKPMPAIPLDPIEFELDNFVGRCLFIHRPVWSYDNDEDGRDYPYKQHFHGRRRLWEFRIQGHFKKRPGRLFAGIELERYVPVSWATQAAMRGMLPLVQRVLGAEVVHELGIEGETSLRPSVLAPIWAADNTLVHWDLAEVPDIACATLPQGLKRKAAKEYWESLWEGEGPSWGESNTDGPTYTIALWGPAQLLDIRKWVFRKLPLTWGKDLSMEPFCGRQPAHAVIYELADSSVASGGTSQKGSRGARARHLQEQKLYIADLRFVRDELWQDMVAEVRQEAPTDLPHQQSHWLSLATAASADLVTAGPALALHVANLRKDGASPSGSFCSAVSHDSEEDEESDIDDESRHLNPHHGSDLDDGFHMSQDSRAGGMITAVVRWLTKPLWLFGPCRRRCKHRSRQPWSSGRRPPGRDGSPFRRLVDGVEHRDLEAGRLDDSRSDV